MPGRQILWRDSLLIFLLASVLILPLFRSKYLDKWNSIESTFIADARMLAETWPGPKWQPLWYCGTRFDYIYPPALRYGTAGLTKILPVVPARAYHLYTAIFFAFGIVAVYLFVHLAAESRVSGWLAALGTALLSPSVLLIPLVRHDSQWVPQRLSVLVRYGEGPHMTALAWLPFGLAFTWRFLKTGRPRDLALAAFGCTMVLHNNFYGATALAILFPILTWSLYITHGEPRMWLRAGGVAVLTYGFASFWFVPSYVLITLANMKYVSQGGNVWSRWVALAAVIAFLVLSDRWARGRRSAAYVTFLAGGAGFFFLNVVGEYYLGFRVIGEPSRMVPELDLLLILCAAEMARRLWLSHRRPLRMAAGLMGAAALVPVCLFLPKAWSLYKPDIGFRDRVEYRLQDWMAKNMPASRAMVAGSIRFWYNAWNNLAQVGGGSEQGMLSPAVVAPQWQILLGDSGELSKLWLQVLAADVVIVNTKASTESYHDYVYPEKFAGLFPVAYDNGKGDVIYRVPRKYPAWARVVRRPELDGLQPITWDADLENLRKHAALLEAGPDRPLEMQWEGFDAFRVRCRNEAQESLVVQVIHGSPWRAWDRDRPVPIRKDPNGFMRLDLEPGDHDLRFQFTLPLENKLGRGVTVVTWLVVIGFLLLPRFRPEVRF